MRGLARIEGGGGRVRPGARGFPSDGGGLARRSASNPTPLEVAGTQMFSGEGVRALSRESRAPSNDRLRTGTIQGNPTV